MNKWVILIASQIYENSNNILLPVYICLVYMLPVYVFLVYINIVVQ